MSGCAAVSPPQAFPFSLLSPSSPLDMEPDAEPPVVPGTRLLSPVLPRQQVQVQQQSFSPVDCVTYRNNIHDVEVIIKALHPRAMLPELLESPNTQDRLLYIGVDYPIDVIFETQAEVTVDTGLAIAVTQGFAVDILPAPPQNNNEVEPYWDTCVPAPVPLETRLTPGTSAFTPLVFRMHNVSRGRLLAKTGTELVRLSIVKL